MYDVEIEHRLQEISKQIEEERTRNYEYTENDRINQLGFNQAKIINDNAIVRQVFDLRTRSIEQLASLRLTKTSLRLTKTRVSLRHIHPPPGVPVSTLDTKTAEEEFSCTPPEGLNPPMGPASYST